MAMYPLPSLLALMLLFGAAPAAAQRGLLEGSSGPRTDILTGEPVRPPSAHPRPEPQIFNAPHAPLQSPGRTSENPPMEIYVAPQYGTSTSGYQSTTGATGQYGTPQVMTPNSLSQYRDRQSQAPQYGSGSRSPSRQYQRN